ncbi:flagellar hook-associated protein FlgK [Ramlibacter alkalitolerans]|uniref:Flagellar hook-associated protein 1 n=1 Tax=Ramlibacter alkalitolerans TaxID=2039631 RepID=A0ABS1JKU6_9BURK|nr:flagellar hook-associated protein FlgK [Ramlibacter alkalitolerans]MBL0424852.1 flagellar hook-associated protein FlgK [Ramlibacter alkalitolerans]
MTSSLLNIGSRALTAAQGSLATVSHNIANANTPGYSRQEAVLATAGGLYTGGGFFGRGVDLTTVRRQYDQFLTGAVQSANSVAAADSVRADGLKAIDAVFGDGELGIGAALDALFSAAGDLANRPADLSARQVFVARAGQFAQRASSVGAQLADLAGQADGRLAQDAAQVNARLADIARLNAQIARGQALGQPPNDLLDQRDAAVQGLGGLLQVHTVAQDDGSLALFTREGAPLLVGQQQARLEAAPDPADPAHRGLRLVTGSTSQWLDAAGLGGGSLAGTLRLRDDDLASAINQVGRIAQVAAAAFNRQQALGVDMDGAPGAPLFAAPAPVARANSGNTGAATLAAGIADPSLLQASDYALRWDGAAYQVTRLADGQSTSAASLPLEIDGLRFSATGAPAAGDTWLVKPFAAAASGLAARQVAPRQVATAFPATVVASAANRGGAGASAFEALRAGADNRLPVTIRFNDPPTSFDVTGLAGGELAGVPYTPGQRVPVSPADYNGWSLTLDGAPAAGDTFAVQPVTAPAADNRNALALAGLAAQALAAGGTLNETYAALVGDVGSRVQSGQAAAQISGQLQDEAVARQQAVAGVNLDEEAANLLRFQQAYQASARVIQASQSLFESLLAATGR